jgi:hypothetical protein
VIGAVVYLPQIYASWRTRTWLKRKEQADEIADKTIHELEEQIEIDDIVHFLTPRKREEIEAKIREYKDET